MRKSEILLLVFAYGSAAFSFGALALYRTTPLPPGAAEKILFRAKTPPPEMMFGDRAEKRLARATAPAETEPARRDAAEGEATMHEASRRRPRSTVSLVAHRTPWNDARWDPSLPPPGRDDFRLDEAATDPTVPSARRDAPPPAALRLFLDDFRYR